MFLTKTNKPLCLGCATKSTESILEINQPCKQYYSNLISKLPIPDYKMANECL